MNDSVMNPNAKELTALECIESLETLFKAYKNDSEFNYQLSVSNSPFNTLKKLLMSQQQENNYIGGRIFNKEILYLKQSIEQCNDKTIYYVSKSFGNKYIVPQIEYEKLNKENAKYKRVLEIIKNKSKNNYNLALVVDSETHEVYCKQFEYFLNDYKEKGGAFEIWEEDKFSLEEYNLLREVFVYGK